MQLERFTFGVGDRFGQQGSAQLEAFKQLESQGVIAVPVWNKSHREHKLIGTNPKETVAEAREAVAQGGWKHGFYVDADHINMGNVGGSGGVGSFLIDGMNFYTIDVAAQIGNSDAGTIDAFVDRHSDLTQGPITLGGQKYTISPDNLREWGNNYADAMAEAARIYSHIVEQIGAGKFIPEVSIDETARPQTPPEVLVILKELGHLEVPVQTIAPKFSGELFKGVDYVDARGSAVGTPENFATEFEGYIGAITHAIEHWDLPVDLKVSMHSGSDKFSVYPLMHEVLNRTGAGLHVKTAGTTWVEEVIGLAEAGGKGYALAQEIARAAVCRLGQFRGPYEEVIDIKEDNLPDRGDINSMSNTDFVAALRHDQGNPAYNRDFRQAVHIAFPKASEMGARYIDALVANKDAVSAAVTANLYERHMVPLFLGK